jgi:hypothetical protein
MRKGQSVADYERSQPDVISAEEFSDHGLTEPSMDALLENRRMALEWLAERIKQGSGAGLRRNRKRSNSGLAATPQNARRRADRSPASNRWRAYSL